MYNKFFKAKKKGRIVMFWYPVWSLVVVEQCVVSGNVTWQKSFPQVVDVLVQVPECTLLMHTTTRSVQLGHEGAAQDASDVYCFSRCCGSLRHGPRKWVPFDVSLVEA